MDARVELILGFFISSVGLFLLVEGWIIVQLNKKIIPLSIRFELWLTKLFQGEIGAEKVKKRKASPEAIHSNGVSFLMLGTATLVGGVFLIIEAWMRMLSG